MEITASITALLFYYAEPMRVSKLAQLLSCTSADILSGLEKLPSTLEGTGIMLVTNGDVVTLTTVPQVSTLIEKITKEELSKELSKAALETLAIVLYKGPIARSEIDYIRGVNSTFILRNLLIRGLVEKIDNPNDQRSFLYGTTLATLEYLGISSSSELPKYHDTLALLGEFTSAKKEEPLEDIKDATNDSLEHDDASAVADGMELSDNDLAREADIADDDAEGAGFHDSEHYADVDEKDDNETRP